MKRNLSFYLKLFTSTFYLSAFTFGGGYVIIPLMRKKFVNEYHWIDEIEMLENEGDTLHLYATAGDKLIQTFVYQKTNEGIRLRVR